MQDGLSEQVAQNARHYARVVWILLDYFNFTHHNHHHQHRRRFNVHFSLLARV